MRTTIIALGATALLGCTIDNGSTEPSGTPVTITWSPCINDINAPSWMAVKDGDGGWTRIIQTNGVYTFTVRSGRVGMATYANGGLTINYVTTDEANASKPTCDGALRNVTGTVTGYTSLDDIYIQPGLGAQLSGATTSPASFTLTDVTPTNFDVLAVRARDIVNGGQFTRTPSAVFIRRSQSTSPLALIDLNGTEAGPPQSRTLTISNAAATEDLVVFSSFNTATAAIDMSQYSTTLGAVSGTVTAPFYGLPSARLSTGDVQLIDVFASIQVNSTTSSSRTATLTYTDVADKSATLGPALGVVSVSGSARPAATYSIQTGYDQAFEVTYNQGTGVSSRSIDVAMSRGYLGSTATSVTLSIPDLTGLNGFQSSWLLTLGATAHYSFLASGSTYSILPTAPATYTAAFRTATFIP